MLIAFLLWWGFMFVTFWLGAGLSYWPYQRSTATYFDWSDPGRKLQVSITISFVQAMVFWFFVTLSSQGAPIIMDLVMVSAMVGLAVPMLAQQITENRFNKWDELDWIALAQFIVWLCVGVIVFLVM